MTLNVLIENISLYKKFLADRNLTDVQREIIGKMLAEEESKLLKLFGGYSSSSAHNNRPGRSARRIRASRQT